MSDNPETDHERSGSNSDKAMGFWEHLNELRATLIKSVLAFAICATLTGYYVFDLKRFVVAPFEKAIAAYPDLGIELVTTAPMEGMNLILESCVFGGATLAAPFILFFIAQFVAPALTQKEAKVVLPMCLAACGLFLGGSAFAYWFVVPSAMEMFININVGLDAGGRWSLGSYYSLFTRTVFGVGAGFEFPLLIVMLSWLGIVSTRFLRTYRRHAIVLLFIVAAVVTPSWDPFIQTLCAVPLYLLYEASIWIATAIEKHRDRTGAAVLVALLALCSHNRSPQKLQISRA